MRDTTTLTDGRAAALRVAATTWALLLPVLALAVATLAAVVPLGLGADWRFAPALMPLAVVHYWADRRSNGHPAPVLPAPLVFAAGLIVDALTSGPLGYWALTYLAGAALAHGAGPALARAGLARWPRFIVVTGLVTAFAWATASLYFASPAAALPLALAAAVVITAEPLIAAVLAALTPVAVGERPSFSDRRA